jgi:hypothetical protein
VVAGHQDGRHQGRVSDGQSPLTSGSDAVDGSSTRHLSAMDMGVTKAPMIRRSYLCKQLRQLALDIAISVSGARR